MPFLEKSLALKNSADMRNRLWAFQQKLAAGEQKFVPSEIVDRLVAGESLVRIWREHRGLSTKVLAAKAEIAQPCLSQIETGKREGTVRTMKQIAEALGVQLDDLV